MALEKQRRGFSVIPAEHIHYADAVDFVIKLAYHKQRASKIKAITLLCKYNFGFNNKKATFKLQW